MFKFFHPCGTLSAAIACRLLLPAGLILLGILPVARRRFASFGSVPLTGIGKVCACGSESFGAVPALSQFAGQRIQVGAHGVREGFVG